MSSACLPSVPARRAVALLALLALAACGGTKGSVGGLLGSSGSPYLPSGANASLATLTNSQTFNTVSAVNQFDLAGGATAASLNSAVGPNTQVTILALGPADGDFQLTVSDSLLQTGGLTHTPVSLTQTFYAATQVDAGFPTVTPSGSVVTAGDVHLLANNIHFTYASPANTGNTYSAYGFWYQTVGTAVTAGAFGIGVPIPLATLPVAGVANYAGYSSGVYTDTGTGVASVYSANVSASVDFGARTISSFATTNAQTAPVGGGVASAAPALNVTQTGGAVSFAGFTTFAVPVANAGNTLSGTAAGSFYQGTVASGFPEMAGVLQLASTAGHGQALVGGFAARH